MIFEQYVEQAENASAAADASNAVKNFGFSMTATPNKWDAVERAAVRWDRPFSRPYGTRFLWLLFPATKVAGYFRVVPAGLGQECILPRH